MENTSQHSEPVGIWYVVLTVFMPDYVAWSRRTMGPEWTRERGPVFNIVEKRHEIITREDGVDVLGDVTDTRTRLVVFMNGEGGEVNYEPWSEDGASYDHIRFAHRDDISPNEDPENYTVPYTDRHGYVEKKKDDR